jgi:protein-S-isoprenylcysteine O-methyltransferase Ste14
LPTLEEAHMNRYKPYALGYVSLFLGLSSMILFTVFLFMGSFSLFDLGLNQSKTLLMNAFLSLLFFAQHSVMIRRGIQEKLLKLMPDAYYSAVYSIVSGITLIAIILLWQKTPGLIASADGLYSWMLRALFFLCIAGFYWGTTSLVSFDPFGVKKIERHLRHKETKPMPMTVQGAYRWVRHPLYFFSLVMIWANPNLTTDRLLFNILWSIWIVIATMFEERDLIHDFGKQYREYQAKVPMIIPYKFPHKA